MSKKKGSASAESEAGEEKRKMVELQAELHRRIKMICSDEGVQIQDFVHSVLEPIVDREYRHRFPGRD